MTKKHYIALADAIKDHNTLVAKIGGTEFQPTQLDSLATFCQRQNPRFNRQRWLDYINGFCGPNGGAVKTPIAKCGNCKKSFTTKGLAVHQHIAHGVTASQVVRLIASLQPEKPKPENPAEVAGRQW